MENMDKIIEIQKKLRPIFEKNDRIGLVYLFGSHAKGTADSRSDFDIAIYFDEPDVIKRNDLLFVISTDIAQALQTDAIDGHSLNDIESPVLRYHIIADGKLLFEREPFKVILEPRILNEYFDFSYLSRKYNLIRP